VPPAFVQDHCLSVRHYHFDKILQASNWCYHKFRIARHVPAMRRDLNIPFLKIHAIQRCQIVGNILVVKSMAKEFPLRQGREDFLKDIQSFQPFRSAD
jgi:hypothetical protein